MEIQILKCKKIIAKICMLSLILGLMFLKDIFLLVQVNGDSMQPTLCDKEYYLAVKCNYNDISKGDIVITRQEFNDNPIIKRVIAIKGDTVEFRDGKIYVNNSLYRTISTFEEFTLKVGDKELFLLGDNIENSYDSRYFGSVTVKDNDCLYKLRYQHD